MKMEMEKGVTQPQGKERLGLRKAGRGGEDPPRALEGALH